MTTLIFIASGGRLAHGNTSPSQVLNFSTAKSREQSENFYENKGQVQKVEQSLPFMRHGHLGHDRARAGCPCHARADFSNSGLLNLSITKSREQSENVYENKVRGQEVEESFPFMRHGHLGRDRARAGCPCHARADSSTSGLFNLSIAKSREQSENVYENKGQGQKVGELTNQGVKPRANHNHLGRRPKRRQGPRLLNSKIQGTIREFP